MITLLWLLACASPEEKACTAMCEQLVYDCDYQAYPSLASCEQGCAYEVGLGVDVFAEQECLETAACDTFEVLNCVNRFGAAGQ